MRMSMMTLFVMIMTMLIVDIMIMMIMNSGWHDDSHQEEERTAQ